MHEYMTRHMVARQAMTYARQDLTAGERFMATPVDADYLERCGRAQSVPAPKFTPTKAEATVAAPAVAPVVAAATLDAAVDAGAESAQLGGDDAAAAEATTEAAAAPAAAPAVPVSRRRRTRSTEAAPGGAEQA